MCGAYLFSTTPRVHMPPTNSCPLASNALTWATFSRLLSCFGFSTRNDVSRLCSRGSPFNCSVLPGRPTHPGQLKPTTLPLRRLAPDSCSVGLSPTLSLPFSPALSPAPHSLSLSSPFFSHCPHSHSLSLSLSRIKGVPGRSVYLYPPRGSNHPLQDRRGQKRCGLSSGL